ncbi:uncharacterized protein LOC134759825 [Pongo abelii]|uniref:uncharacterized protein LOC134759825 n=1 Tax=Pongo abelii TaxID=9601 RepID=UPI003007024F
MGLGESHHRGAPLSSQAPRGGVDTLPGGPGIRHPQAHLEAASLQDSRQGLGPSSQPSTPLPFCPQPPARESGSPGPCPSPRQSRLSLRAAGQSTCLHECHEDWRWVYQDHPHDVSQGSHGLPLPREDQHLVLSTPSFPLPSTWLHSAAMPLPPDVASTLQDFISVHPKAEDVAGQQEIPGASRKTSKRWWSRGHHTQTAVCNCAAASCCGCWPECILCTLDCVTTGRLLPEEELLAAKAYVPGNQRGCCRRRAAGCSSSDPTQGFRGHRA